ncbi:MAG TPA: DnrO protein [Dokdonella sp.]|nr:DnrO protein [Dokdonella sp.]
MQTRHAPAPFLAALLGLALPAMAQHVHEAHEPAAATASPAQRHATDAPLREGMARIHAALEELRHYEMGHMPKPVAIERVDAIQAATDYLFANCKLDAQADAALHGMLAPLLAGVQAFRKNPDDTSTIAAMRQAVADYPRVFDDPQWRVEVDAASQSAD